MLPIRGSAVLKPEFWVYLPYIQASCGNLLRNSFSAIVYSLLPSKQFLASHSQFALTLRQINQTQVIKRFDRRQ